MEIQAVIKHHLVVPQSTGILWILEVGDII